MKAYILTQDDIDLLTIMVDRNPRHGPTGGSSQVLSKEENAAHEEAHSFYNYQVRTWIQKVTK
jgi:hypothetical protein